MQKIFEAHCEEARDLCPFLKTVIVLSLLMMKAVSPKTALDFSISPSNFIGSPMS